MKSTKAVDCNMIAVYFEVGKTFLCVFLVFLVSLIFLFLSIWCSHQLAFLAPDSRVLAKILQTFLSHLKETSSYFAFVSNTCFLSSHACVSVCVCVCSAHSARNDKLANLLVFAMLSWMFAGWPFVVLQLLFCEWLPCRRFFHYYWPQIRLFTRLWRVYFKLFVHFFSKFDGHPMCCLMWWAKKASKLETFDKQQHFGAVIHPLSRLADRSDQA